jgi:hypothetical protein
MRSRRFRRTRAVPVALLALATLGAGCASLDSPDAVSAHVARLRGTKYQPEGSWQVGRHAFGFFRAVSGGAEEGTVLAGIRDVKVGTYRATAPARDAHPLRVEDFRGYEAVAARQSKAGDAVMLLSRGKGDEVEELLLVVDGAEKLSVVQVRGDLTGLVDKASALAFDKAERADLAQEFAGDIPPGK